MKTSWRVDKLEEQNLGGLKKRNSKWEFFVSFLVIPENWKLKLFSFGLEFLPSINQ